MDAAFVLFVAESVALHVQEDELEKIKNNYSSIIDHPDAVEVVSFILETKQKRWLGTANIIEGRIMGEVEWKDGYDSTGRFTNLLSPDPTLH